MYSLRSTMFSQQAIIGQHVAVSHKWCKTEPRQFSCALMLTVAATINDFG